MPPVNDRYEKYLRGSTLYLIYTAYTEGLTDASSPRTLPKLVLEMTLSSRGLYPENDMPRCLEWLEGSEYVTVEWGMDTKLDYDSVTITQKGINIVEDRNARTKESGMTLPPRR